MMSRPHARPTAALALLTLLAVPAVHARDEAELPRERGRRAPELRQPAPAAPEAPVTRTAVVPLEPIAQPQAPNAAPAAVAAGSEAQDEVTRELIDILSAKGLLDAADVERLLAKLRDQAGKRVAARTPAAPVASPEAIAAAAPGGAEAPKPGTVRVVYLPEAEKQRIRAEIRDEVMATARSENWAQPDALPEWTRRFTLGGDFRVREELVYFDRQNALFVDFNAINAGQAYDVSNNAINPPPLRNTTVDRSQPRLRARLNIEAKVDEQLDAVFRIASGNVRNPVSTNVTLGNSFSNFALFIDRAYFDWRPLPGLDVQAGRLPNPWLATSMLWDEDLNFDGGVVHYTQDAGALTPFLTVGAFSVQNTDFDFPSLRGDKIKSRDKYLYGAQLGSRFQLGERSNAQVAVAYYYFDKLNGERSAGCLALVPEDPCSSDLSRAGFGQGGNTQFAIRDLLVDASDPDGPQFQYFGLAAPFRELAWTGRLDLDIGGGLRTVLTGEYVWNLGYRESRVAALEPANNYSESAPGTPNVLGPYSGGNRGYALTLLTGYPVIRARGQWNIEGGYRHVESDAVVDAFTDSDFHLGGTNARGYTLFARYGIGRDVWLTGRWLSATEISGAPFAVDVLQLDLQARF